MKKYLIVFLFFIELLLFVKSSTFTPITNGILLFLVSLSIGLIPLLKLKSIHSGDIGSDLKSSNTYNILFYTILLIIVANLIFFTTLAKYSVEPIYSDVIPSIKALVDRFLAGESVYGTPIPFIGYEVPPTYLPMQWGPYIIAEKLGFDYRALAFIVFILSILIYVYYVVKSSLEPFKKGLLVSLPFVILFSLFYYTTMEFVYTVETMVVGFYLLLAASFFSKSPLLKSIAIVLCLLSRFSLLLWLPMYFVVLLLDSRKDLIRIVIYSGVGVLLLYVIPFLFNDWGAFMRGYNYYTKAALSEWQTQGYQQAGEDPMHLFEGIGLTSIFYKYLPGVVEFKLAVLQKTHFILSILTTVVLSVYYYVLKRRKVSFNTSLFLLFSFKIYLTIFYSFIQVPYKYLFFVPLFISIYVVYKVIESEKKIIFSE